MFKRERIVRGEHVEDPRFIELSRGWGDFSPANISRWAQLAGVLEPMVHSPGKTTRHSDCSPQQRLVYFLTAGINVGESFRQLAARCQGSRAVSANQPLLYDLVLQAQVDSKNQRDGSRVNQGIIEMLVPFVAAQILYLDSSPQPNNVQDAFMHTTTVLKNTTQEDVDHLCTSADLAWGMGGPSSGCLAVSATTVYGYYEERSAQFDWPVFDPFLNGYRTAERIVEEVVGTFGYLGADHSLSDVVSQSCARVRASLPGRYYSGQFADDTAVALYALLSHYPDQEVIF